MTILDDVKNGTSVGLFNDGFDDELLMLINSAAASLSQIGVSEFNIEIDDGTLWPTLATQELTALTKHYIVLKTKIAFDPSASEAINRALEASVPVLEGRISLIVFELTVAP